MTTLRPGSRGWLRPCRILSFFFAGYVLAVPVGQAAWTEEDNGDPLPPGEEVPGEVLVKLRPEPGRVAPQNHEWFGEIATAVEFLGEFPQPGLHGRHGPPPVRPALDYMVRLRLRPEVSVAEAVERLKRHPSVEYAEPNYRLRLALTPAASRTPNDFHLERLWNLHNTGQTGGKPGADIKALSAWTLSTGSRAVVVAVIDTGMDYYHPDLEPNIWHNPHEAAGTGVDNDQNGFIDDLHGYDFVSGDSHPFDDNHHGTHVAGIIGAVGDNRQGIAGVCWSVSLMAVKAFDERGESSTAQAVQAIHYALRNGAHILNASWGTATPSRALEEIVGEAVAAGTLFVAAAGNANSSAPFYPAAYPGVLAVAATNHKDERASFSNHGPYVAVAAPGDAILSTLPNNQYQALSGTSMAAPHVSGLAALLMARQPHFSAQEIANIIRNTADYLVTDRFIGAGRINALRALQTEQPLPRAALELPEVVEGDFLISGSATGDGFASYLVEYGKGPSPEVWHAVHVSFVPADGPELAPPFASAGLEEGIYSFRLTVRNQFGGSATSRALTKLQNVRITSPMYNDIFRAGTLIPITGTVYGTGRRYQLEHGRGPQPLEWSTDGIHLVARGQQQRVNQTLAYWDTTQLEPDEFYSLRLTAWNGAGGTNAHSVHLLYLDSHLKEGWPVHLPIPGELPAREWRQLAVGDLDGNGVEEIVLVDSGDGRDAPARVQVFHADGALKWSRPLEGTGSAAHPPALGDLEGGGSQAVFAEAGGKLFAFQHDGTPLPGLWPLALEAGGLALSLADVTRNGRLELIGYSQESVRRGGADYRQLSVWNYEGHLVHRWELEACFSSSHDVLTVFPAVADLDSTPELEIVVSSCSTLFVYSLHEPARPLWSRPVAGALLSSPVVGDLTGDGEMEIVVAAAGRMGRSSGGGIYLFNAHGSLLPGWPALSEESFLTTPALADLDGDGRLEIIVPSWSSQRLHVLHSDGFPMEGWPVSAGSLGALKSSPVIGDITGNGRLNIVIAAPGRWNALHQPGADLVQVGGVRAWDAQGRDIDLKPLSVVQTLPMEGSVGAWQKTPPLILTDLEGNGKLDILGVSIQDRTYAPPGEGNVRKQRSSLYVWELDVPWDGQLMPWPRYMAGPHRTGWLRSPPRPNAPPVVLAIPNQVIPPGAEFFPLALDRYVEDADHHPRELTWTLSGHQDLLIELTPERVLLVRVPHPGWTGRETLSITVTDPAGDSDSVTAFFEVRPDYIPPQAAPDRVTILEDTVIDVDVLANDASPDGTPLQVTQVSQPEFGRTRINSDGTVQYTPDQDYFGEDSFTYVVGSAGGGMAIGVVQLTILPVNDPPTAVPDRVITDEDTPVTIEVLANDFDVDGDPIRLVDFTQPEHGTAVRLPHDLIHYVPQDDYFGMDGFEYTIADPFGLTATGQVTILVRPVNDPPVAQDQHFTLNRNAHVTVAFLGTDVDGDKLTYRVVDGPVHGELWAYPAVASYYPEPGFSGSDRFTYLADDGLEVSNLATVTFDVLDANNPPVAESLSLTNKPNQELTITLKASDLDGDPLTFSLLDLPAHGELTGAGSEYLYRPAPDYLGPDRLTFRVFDGMDFSSLGVVDLTMTDVNTAPVAKAMWLSTFLDQPKEFTVNASDPEGDPMTITIVQPPLYGRVEGGESPLLTYLPQAGFLGHDRFAYVASDGWLESAPALVQISVVYPNHPPVATHQTVRTARDTPVVVQLHVSDLDQDELRTVILKGPQKGLLAGLGTTFSFTPNPGVTGTDRFTYKAWDGFAYSNEGRVTIEITPLPPAAPPEQPEIESIEVRPDGELRITVRTVPGEEIRVESSTNLRDWKLFRRLLPMGGTAEIVANLDNQPARFYRVVSP